MPSRRPRKLPPVKTWTEQVDDKTVAGLATCMEIRNRRGWIEVEGHPDVYGHRRELYGLSIFVLVPREVGWGYKARAAAEQRLYEVIVDRQGRLPFMGLAQDGMPGE